MTLYSPASPGIVGGCCGRFAASHKPCCKPYQGSAWEESKAGRYLFFTVWNAVHAQILEAGLKSIDAMTDKLVKSGSLVITENYMAKSSAQDLVFSIIGWQTMLYRPDFSADLITHFSLTNEMDGYTGEAYLCSSQPRLAGTRSLPDFLLGFGMMLPPRNYCAFDDLNDKKAFAHTKTVASRDVNAYVLAGVCGVKFRWVDCLSCHLELDGESNALYLYRYPSFCVSALRQQNVKNGQRSAIHSCAFDGTAPANWADEDDVTELLEEILLSYRLIFGQDQRSRRLFKKLRPFDGVPREGQDRLLPELCGRKRFDCGIALDEQEEYDVVGDFSHLRSRIVRLSGYASTKKPRSLRQLWVDNRDSAAWLTFWAVLVFGALGILLALVQTVFQILQYTQGADQ